MCRVFGVGFYWSCLLFWFLGRWLFLDSVVGGLLNFVIGWIVGRVFIRRFF